jgi:hypothetical protein
MAPHNLPDNGAPSRSIVRRTAAVGLLLVALLLTLYWALQSQRAFGGQPPAIVDFQGTNTSLETLTPGALDRNSTGEEIRQAINNSTWQTLWVEGELITQSQDQQPHQQKHQYIQAWFSREGVRRVMASRQQDYAPAGSSTNDWVAYAWLSDGEMLSIFDIDRDPTLTHILVELLSVRPEIYQPVVLMIDGHITTYRSDLPEAIQLEYADGYGNLIETIAGREAVVVDWGSERLWVDTQTGVLLRWQRYEGQPGGSEIVLDMAIHNIRIGPPLPENIMDRERLQDLQFEPPPGTGQS